MSEWNHPQCDDCWDALHPDRTPIRIIEPETEKCCWCGQYTTSGIYVRDNPKGPLRHSPHDWETG